MTDTTNILEAGNESASVNLPMASASMFGQEDAPIVADASNVSDDGLGKLSGAASVEDVFAGQFQIYFPRFCILLNGLGKSAQTQLLKHLVAGPLAPQEYKPKNKKEKELFILGNALLFSRYTLEFQALAQQMEKEQQELDANKVSSVQGESVEQVTPPSELNG